MVFLIESAATIARRIADGQMTAVQMTTAALDHIELDNPQLNAVIHLLADEALSQAKTADELQAAGQPLGPLHGVPITVKDCFALRGTEITLGIEGFSPGIAETDSPLVARLKAAGAIVLGKTNVPQGMLLHECDNPLHGRTLHLFSDERSPGGSSGGEAAIVAAGGSAFGLASDLGGSIRQPAAACGVCGLKPTASRLTTLGSERAMPGFRAMPIAPGPIARTVEDLDLAMRAMLPTDQTACEADEQLAPWHDYHEVDVTRLRLAYWTDDGITKIATGVRRAVQESVERLKTLGAIVERVTPFNMPEMMRLYFSLISADGMGSLRRLLKGVKVDHQLRRQLRLGRLPRRARSLIATLLKYAGQPELAQLLCWTGPRSADEYWQLTVAADAYRQQFWDSLEGYDAIVLPPYAFPALRHGTALHLLLGASHCFLANLLDAPAGVVPWGVVTDDDEQSERATRRSSWAIPQRFAKQNAIGSSGLPLAVQVVSRPNREEIVLAVMNALEAQSKRSE